METVKQENGKLLLQFLEILAYSGLSDKKVNGCPGNAFMPENLVEKM